jgi:hypothetical protein
VVAGPPADGTLDCAAAKEGEGDLNGERGRVGGVGPESVVAFFFISFPCFFRSNGNVMYQQLSQAQSRNSKIESKQQSSRSRVSRR